MPIAVVGSVDDKAASALRTAALGTNFPFTIVHSLDPARDARELEVLGIKPEGSTAFAKAFHAGKESQPLRDAAALRGVVASIRESYLLDLKEKKKAADEPPRRTPGPQPGAPGAPTKAPVPAPPPPEAKK